MKTCFLLALLSEVMRICINNNIMNEFINDL